MFNWLYPTVSRTYCYRSLLLITFLLIVLGFIQLDLSPIAKILFLLAMLPTTELIVRKIIAQKFSPGLLYFLAIVFPTIFATIPSVNYLLSTTQINIISLFYGFFAFINFLSAAPSIYVTVIFLGGGLAYAPLLEKIMGKSITTESVQFLSGIDIKLVALLVFAAIHLYYSSNFGLSFLTVYGIHNILYPITRPGLSDKFK